MKSQLSGTAHCPLCGQTYGGHPAISRTDNKTRICPDCGTREALAALGVGENEREKIVRIIRAHTAAECGQ